MRRIQSDQNRVLNSQLSFLMSSIFKKQDIAKRIERLLPKIHGPTPVWPIGNLKDFIMKPPYKVLQNYHHQYGDNVSFWLFNKPAILVTQPEDIKLIVENSIDIYKNSPKHAAGKYFLSSVFFANGSEWHDKRKAHPFSHSDINTLFSNAVVTIKQLTSCHAILLNPTDRKKEILLFDEMTQLSFNIFSHLLLDQEGTKDLFDCYLTQMEDMHRRGATPLSLPNLLLKKRIKGWKRYVEKALNKYERSDKEQSNKPTNLPQWLSELKITNRDNFTLLRDEISTSFYAGTRNVAATISFVIQLLSAHKDVYQKLQRSIDEFVTEHPQGYSDSDLDKLEYLDMVIKETLRLYPIVPAFFREVLPGRTIKLPFGSLPEKTQIFISSWVTHRDANLWKNPNDFMPERFNTKPTEHSYLPFGSGDRICVGMGLTQLITKVVIVELMQKLNFHSILPSNSSQIDNEYFAGIIIPSDGLAIDISKHLVSEV